MVTKTVDDSRVETVHIVRPNHLNGANRLFGGILIVCSAAMNLLWLVLWSALI